jgi:hypothetical protein
MKKQKKREKVKFSNPINAKIQNKEDNNSDDIKNVIKHFNQKVKSDVLPVTKLLDPLKDTYQTVKSVSDQIVQATGGSVLGDISKQLTNLPEIGAITAINEPLEKLNENIANFQKIGGLYSVIKDPVSVFPNTLSAKTQEEINQDAIKEKLEKIQKDINKVKKPNRKTPNIIPEDLGLQKIVEEIKNGVEVFWYCDSCGRIIKKFAGTAGATEFESIYRAFNEGKFQVCEEKHRNWFVIQNNNIIRASESSIDSFIDRMKKRMDKEAKKKLDK